MLSIALYLLSHAMLLSLHLSGGSFPRPLSAQEEKKYVEQMLAGDLEARNVLVAHNLRLVVHIAKKYYTQSDEQDDLISIGKMCIRDSYNAGDMCYVICEAIDLYHNNKDAYAALQKRG